VKIKYFLVFIIIISIGLLYADPPAGYYDAADSLSGSALKSTLNDIISGHTQYSYDNLRDFVLPDTDEDTENSNNIILIYTGRSQPKSSFGSGANDWNREHVWAKSHGDFGNSPPCGTDAHMLHPCDSSVNSTRGNKDFDNGGSAVYDLGYLAGYQDGDSWEPPDPVKGDIARTIFYMAVRYEGENGELDLEVVDEVETYPLPEHGKLSALYQWNIDDPPDNWERLRNDKVYGWQNNRNPFIDHPEYVDYIWGGEIPNDNIPPTISDVIVLDTANIVIDFSEYVEQISAETISNYSIDNGIGAPLTAALGYNSDNSKVLLNVNMLTPAVSYTVTINNVEDLNENVIAINSDFVFEMTNTVHLLGESFEEGTDNWILYSIASNEDWYRRGASSYFVYPSTVPDGNYFMYVNNYDADEAANDWLLYPELDLSNHSSALLSFYSWTYFEDSIPGLELKCSFNYDGSSDPSGASWAAIPVTLSTLESGLWTLADEDDLSVIDGQNSVFLAFHYTSTGNENDYCSAWAIDNVILTAEFEPDPILDIPQNVQISYSGSSVELTWNEVNGAVSYNIYSSYDPYDDFLNWELIGTVTGSTAWSSSVSDDRKFYKVTAE